MNTIFGNTALQLPVETDVAGLQADLQTCLESSWKEHYNQRDYSGSWTAIALRSQSGNTQDILAASSDRPFADTALMALCPHFHELLATLQFEKETIRLLRLAPGSVINEHRDRGLAYRFDCFRLHIPIVTDASVAFTVHGRNIPMQRGECWYADFDLPHSVKNDSTQERIHLVIDGIRNAWTDALFAEAGYDFKEEKKQLDHPVDMKKQMIKQLKLLQTPVAEALIRKLEQEIAESTSADAKP